MKKKDFMYKITSQQVEWKKKNISDKRTQTWTNGKVYEHLLPKDIWDQGVWNGIRQNLILYLMEHDVQAHTSKYSLRSSWVLCSNLYFPLKFSDYMRQLMVKFLKEKVSSSIQSIEDIELEFAFPVGDNLNPLDLLGEKEGRRGAGQTSPDIAFIVSTKNGKGLILIENKYSEGSFYRCSARTRDGKNDKPGNPDPNRCMDKDDFTCYKDICHQREWGRQYWDILRLSKLGRSTLNNCPAATNGYQLFRQQSLAEGIAVSGKFDLVINAVAYDNNNTSLISCLRNTGVENWTKDWIKMFDGQSHFSTWTHQEWVDFVRSNQSRNKCKDWLEYVENRYGY
jgi:hypothetical protein